MFLVSAKFQINCQLKMLVRTKSQLSTSILTVNSILLILLLMKVVTQQLRV